LKEVANSTIDSCLDLLENFASLLAEDQMINYPIPQKIGIGVTRGSACCILSKDKTEDKILDYSGGILNLASRLMDLARPSGIVIDDSFGVNMLKDETKELFSEDTVYLKGIAEENPRKIHYTRKHTFIPDRYHHPLREPKWVTEMYPVSFKTLKRLGKSAKKVSMNLGQEPLDETRILVMLSYPHPDVEGYNVSHDYSISDEMFEYKHRGNTRSVQVICNMLSKLLEEQGVTKDVNIQLEVAYPVK
jgi:hypothetical protein